MNPEITPKPKYSLWTRLKWLFEPWVADAPEALDYCEYECRRPQCTAPSWDTCELRLGRPESLAMVTVPVRSPRSYPSYRP